MKKIFLSGLIFISTLFISCEQPLGDEEIPYELKIVVSGTLYPYQQVKDIYIGRTLPISYSYSEEFGALGDANAVIECEGKYYPLKHTGKGLYANDTLTSEPGKRYVLIVSYENKLATAETKLPGAGVINKLSLALKDIGGVKENYVNAVIKPHDDEVYAVSWIFMLPNGFISKEATEVPEVTGSRDHAALTVNSAVIPHYLINSSRENLAVRIHIFDKQFRDYFITKPNSEITDQIYGQTRSNVKWNVKGDGIGLFIGKMELVQRVK